MAIVRAYQAIDMRSPDIWYGNVSAATSNLIQITVGPYVQNYYGYGFSYNSYTVTGGVVTGSDYYAFGTKIWEVSGGSYSAVTVANYIQSGNAIGLHNYVLAGNDSFYGSPDHDALIGYAGNDVIYAGGGNDVLIGDRGDDTLDGGAGIDVAQFSGYRSQYEIVKMATGWVVRDNITGRDGFDTLIDVERLQFADARIALDIEGNAGKVYRLYQAAFNRTPDKIGLAYWINQADNGMSLSQIASYFAGGVEFHNKYGNLDNLGYVNQLYQNILGRAGEAAGVAYWTWQLNDGHQGRAEVLSGFSESAENQARVIGSIQYGIDYTV